MRRLMLVGLVVLILAAGFSLQEIRPVQDPRPRPEFERAPAPTTPFQSVSRRLFHNTMDVSQFDPPSAGPLLSLRLHNEYGKLFANQLSLQVDEGKSLKLFVSIWNHTDQHQSLALLPTIDYQVVSVRIDDQGETTAYRMELEPNEAIEVPISIPLDRYAAGLHDLIFVVVKKPDAFAAEDFSVDAFGGFASRHSLWIGPEKPATLDLKPASASGAPSAESVYSIGVSKPAIHHGAAKAKAGRPIPITVSGESPGPWKAIVLIDNQQVETAVASEKAGTVRMAGELPSLRPGKHEAIAVFVLDPFDPVTGPVGQPVARPGRIVQRFTLIVE